MFYRVAPMAAEPLLKQCRLLNMMGGGNEMRIILNMCSPSTDCNVDVDVQIAQFSFATRGPYGRALRVYNNSVC